MNKPEKYVLVSYRYNEFLTFSGTFEPAFQLQVVSLNDITTETTEGYSKALFAFLDETLGVRGDRGYIVFQDPGPAYLGHDGTTFAQIFAKFAK